MSRGGPRPVRRAAAAVMAAAALLSGAAGCSGSGADLPADEPVPGWVAELAAHSGDADRVRSRLSEGAEADQRPRVAELVSQWLWRVDEAQAAQLGQALHLAAAGTAAQPPDERSAPLFAALVAALDRQLQAGERGELGPAPVRPAIASTIASYVVDVNRAVLDSAPLAEPGLTLDPDSVIRVLQALGRDQESYQPARVAQHEYLASALCHTLSDRAGEDRPLAARLTAAEAVVAGHWQLLFRTDAGVVVTPGLDELAQLELLLDRWGRDQAAQQVITSGELPAWPGFLPEPGAEESPARRALAAAFAPAPTPPADRPGVARTEQLMRQELADRLADSGQGMLRLLESVAYDCAPLDQLPDEFMDPATGASYPRSQWPEHGLVDAWQTYLGDTVEGNELQAAASAARAAMEAAYQQWLPTIAG